MTMSRSPGNGSKQRLLQMKSPRLNFCLLSPHSLLDLMCRKVTSSSTHWPPRWKNSAISCPCRMSLTALFQGCGTSCSLHMTNLMISLRHTRGGSKELPLLSYKYLLFNPPQVYDELQNKLKRLSRKVKRRGGAYNFLNPEKVACSIDI